MSQLLHQCLTKATIAEGDQRQYGPRWITARRGKLQVFDDHLHCGHWSIPYPEITDAVLYSFRSTFLRIPGYLLTVSTAEKTYHFGLNGWGSFWKNDLPFPVRREQGKLRYTWFSIAVRLLLFCYLIYLLGMWIFRLKTGE
ncbi:MAG: hypothetical protein C0478_10150 [Planctomyces sp.]|nr:hypothetical protein [Planctomyces sp.]